MTGSQEPEQGVEMLSSTQAGKWPDTWPEVWHHLIPSKAGNGFPTQLPCCAGRFLPSLWQIGIRPPLPALARSACSSKCHSALTEAGRSLQEEAEEPWAKAATARPQ